MIFRPSIAFLLACVLAGCGGNATSGPVPDDWRALLAAHDSAGAEAALRRALDAGAPPARLAPWFGEAAMGRGDLAEAERWLAREDFAPDTAAHGWHMLGRLRMLQGDLPAAGRAFDEALALAPDDPVLWTDIGRLRWRGGEQAQAIEASDRALTSAPHDPSALLFRAQLTRDSSGNAIALPLLERGLEAAPRDPDLLGEYAATLGELGRASDMLAAIRRLSVVAPADERALWLQAILAARAGQYDLSRSLLQRSGFAERQVPAAMLLLAVLDMEQGNYASAAQGLDVLSRRQPDNRAVRLIMARALALGGNHRELIARFAEEAETPYLAMLVGRSYEALGDRAKAGPYLDRAKAGGDLRIVVIPARTGIDLVEQSTVAYGEGTVQVVRELLGTGRAGAARRASTAFLTAHSGSADALALAGDAAFSAGDAKAATALYARSARIRRSWPLVKRMVMALDRLGRHREATDLIAVHLAGEPANADAAAFLARRLFDKGGQQRAGLLLNYVRERGRNDPILGRLAES